MCSPSAPLIPLLAKIPNAVFNSAIPPFTDLTVAPIVSIPSPNYAKDVLVVDEVFAI